MGIFFCYTEKKVQKTKSEMRTPSLNLKKKICTDCCSLIQKLQNVLIFFLFKQVARLSYF
jgi:hypothetical protein